MGVPRDELVRSIHHWLQKFEEDMMLWDCDSGEKLAAVYASVPKITHFHL